MLPRSLTKRLVNHAPPSDVTEGYAADWTVEQLREPAQRMADHIDTLMAAEWRDVVTAKVIPRLRRVSKLYAPPNSTLVVVDQTSSLVAIRTHLTDWLASEDERPHVLRKIVVVDLK